jgi:hypothetical protein
MTFDDKSIARDLGIRVRELLAAHDPAQTAPREFLRARFDDDLAFIQDTPAAACGSERQIRSVVLAIRVSGGGGSGAALESIPHKVRGGHRGR